MMFVTLSYISPESFDFHRGYSVIIYEKCMEDIVPDIKLKGVT